MCYNIFSTHFDLYAEKYHNSTITYLDSIPNVGLLTDNPDIEISRTSQ